MVSLELFPDLKDGHERAVATAGGFAPAETGFVSVTCKSGRFAQTLELCGQLQDAGHSAAAHLLCGGRPRPQIEHQIDQCVAAGIDKIVALRGDEPAAGAGADVIQHTDELVAMLSERGEFAEIMVGGFPEIHPESATLAQDLQYLGKKVDAGATRIITQFCFVPDNLCRYRDLIAGAGITVPISAGLLPIYDFDRMLAFARRCKAVVPQSLHDRFAGLEKSDSRKRAQELLDSLSCRLVAEGFDIHYYTLNLSRMISRSWQQVVGQRAPAAYGSAAAGC